MFDEDHKKLKDSNSCIYEGAVGCRVSSVAGCQVTGGRVAGCRVCLHQPATHVDTHGHGDFTAHFPFSEDFPVSDYCD